MICLSFSGFGMIKNPAFSAMVLQWFGFVLLLDLCPWLIEATIDVLLSVFIVVVISVVLFVVF